MKFNEWLEYRILAESAGLDFLGARLASHPQEIKGKGYLFEFIFPGSSFSSKKEKPSVDYEHLRRLTHYAASRGSNSKGSGITAPYVDTGFGASFGNALFKGFQRSEWDPFKLVKSIVGIGQGEEGSPPLSNIILPLQLPSVGGTPAAGINVNRVEPYAGKIIGKSLLKLIFNSAPTLITHIRGQGEIGSGFADKFDEPTDDFSTQKAITFTMGLAIMILWQANISGEKTGA